jgi:hypothetical protein
MLTQAQDTALVSGGREGVNSRHVVRNVFLLKLVTLHVSKMLAITHKTTWCHNPDNSKHINCCENLKLLLYAQQQKLNF